jgi:hypothetical protein
MILTFTKVIRNEKLPMVAKMRAKSYRDQMVVAPQSSQDVGCEYCFWNRAMQPSSRIAANARAARAYSGARRSSKINGTGPSEPDSLACERL